MRPGSRARYRDDAISADRSSPYTTIRELLFASLRTRSYHIRPRGATRDFEGIAMTYRYTQIRDIQRALALAPSR